MVSQGVWGMAVRLQYLWQAHGGAPKKPHTITDPLPSCSCWRMLQAAVCCSAAGVVASSTSPDVLSCLLVAPPCSGHGKPSWFLKYIWTKFCTIVLILISLHGDNIEVYKYDGLLFRLSASLFWAGVMKPVSRCVGTETTRAYETIEAGIVLHFSPPSRPRFHEDVELWQLLLCSHRCSARCARGFGFVCLRGLERRHAEREGKRRLRRVCINKTTGDGQTRAQTGGPPATGSDTKHTTMYKTHSVGGSGLHLGFDLNCLSVSGVVDRSLIYLFLISFWKSVFWFLSRR